MNVAIAGIPGAWSSERMAGALRDAGATATVFDPGAVTHDLQSGDVRVGELDLGSCDAIVVKKLGDQGSAWSRLRLHALRALESRGARIFSRPDVIDVAMDRYRMTMMLAAAGLPIPETIAAESATAVRHAISTLGDSVVKPIYTSKGRGMIRVDGRDPIALAALAIDEGQRYLVQRFVEAPGRDIGATVVGGQFVGAFYRVAPQGEWMTTTRSGGRYAPCELSSLGVEFAERAAAAFGLDYTVVDLVEQGDGFLLYEVSAFGGFRGLYDACNVDAARLYAEYIAKELGA